MDEACEESLVRRMAKNSAPAVSKANAGRKHCIESSTEDMDDKENIFTGSESSFDISAAPLAMPPTRRAKKGGGCNLRKSLAWNKAFFTEEGVLDPMELSILNGPAAKSSVSLLKGINGDISPLASYSISNRSSLDRKAHQGSALDGKKGGDLLSTLEPSGHKVSVPHVIPEKATSCKSICRSIPRCPAVSSQKRLANSKTSNPESKIPRFIATRPQTSSVTPTARCSAPSKVYFSQNLKPANIEQNARSNGSLSTPNMDLNYPASLSRKSENEKKIANETSEFHVSTDTQTSEIGKCISYLRTPQSQLPPNRLPASVGSSNCDEGTHSFSRNAQYLQGGHHPAQGQGKPSGLRMPTPSLGFFCQAKIPPRGPQLQKESKKSGTSDCSSQSLKNSYSLKHTDGFKTLHPPHGQPGGSESTRMEASAIVVSTPFSSRNAGHLGNLIMPSVTNPAMGKDIDREASKRKILRSAIKPQVACSQEIDEEELHSYCLMDEINMGKQPGSQGSGCEPESPNHPVSSADNSSLPVEKKFANTLTQTKGFENAGGIYLSSEDPERHQLVKSNVMLQKCSPKQSQEGDCQISESVMCQQWEDACETSVSIGNECSPYEEHDSFSCLSFENNEKVVDTSLTCSEMPIAGRIHSSIDNVVSSVEGENTECAVHGVGQCELTHDIILSKEVPGAEKSGHQDCGVSSPRKKSQTASQDKSEVILDKQPLVEEQAQIPILLNQLKAAPFSDEWIAAVESCGEDILQTKTGAVQNSPPDKLIPKLGPWSPVKRKNQDIGPYDCTKYGKSLPTAGTP